MNIKLIYYISQSNSLINLSNNRGNLMQTYLLLMKTFHIEPIENSIM